MKTPHSTTGIMRSVDPTSFQERATANNVSFGTVSLANSVSLDYLTLKSPSVSTGTLLVSVHTEAETELVKTMQADGHSNKEIFDALMELRETEKEKTNDKTSSRNP